VGKRPLARLKNPQSKAMKNPSKPAFADGFRGFSVNYDFINQTKIAKIIAIRKIFHSHFVKEIHEGVTCNDISIER
jgi:hypothetical protein